MAIYRSIQMTFWTDIKISEYFTPEDKYFYLYLFTNPHTNLAGCYEISLRQMVSETGYSKETIERLLKRFSEVHKVAYYNYDTNELLIVNWHKYNWTTSDKFRKPLETQIKNIKYVGFKEYLTHLFNQGDTVSIPYAYPMDTICIDTSVSVKDIDTITPISDKYIDLINKNITEHNYSESINIILTDWFIYKREKGQSYKPMGIKKLLNKIDKVLLEHSEEDLINVINECMERNYQGIILELLDKNKNGNRGSAYIDAINNRLNVVDEWLKEG